MGSFEWINTWGITPSILSLSSFSKPFMTDVTIMRAATPIVKPITAIIEVKDTKAPLLDLKYFRPREAASLNITLVVILGRLQYYPYMEVL